MKRTTMACALAVALACATSHAAVLPRFPAGAVWNQDISQAAPHPDSASMLNVLANLCTGDSTGCGFGLGRMQIDFSITVLQAPANAPTAPLVPHAAYGYDWTPDCDPLGAAIPLPPGGAIEGSTNYQCDNENNDCHLLVQQGNLLYELYSANVNGSNQVEALCLARWNLDVVYPEQQRGEHCTSADAAGFPIAPLLFNADEIHAALQKPALVDQHLGHAIRFILPNDRMASRAGQTQAPQRNLYVRPATHSGGPDGPEGSVPYGSRLRLRADFPFDGYTPAAQVVLRTMQKYGIVLADGGNVALTAESDQFTTHKWSDADVDLGAGGTNPARAFSDSIAATTNVTVNDFVVIDTGPRIQETWDCVRTNVSLDPAEAPLFSNGFE